MLLALAFASTLFAAGQSAEEDPLPPLPPVDPNQQPPADWSGWLGVTKILGVSQADITSSWSFSGELTRNRQSDQQHTTVFMELEAPSPEEFIPGSMVWWKVVSANASASIMSTYSSYGLGGGRWTGGEGMTQGSYNGPLSLRVEPRLSFSLRDGKGQFSTLGEPVAAWGAESSGTVTESSGNGVVTRSYSEVVMRGHLEASTVHFTAPKAVGPFSGRFFVEGPSGDGSGRGEGSFQRTASFQFWPDWNDLEVEVEIEDSTNPGSSYTNWRPEGNLESPELGGPRPLRLKATLKPKAESPTPEQLAAIPPVRRFRFEMSDISREPGVCMNWPRPPSTNAPPDDPEFDLRFIATVPDAMVLSPKKSKAGVIPLPGADPNLPSAWVLMECFDFGAHATLQVYAELADGREILGHLKVGEEKRYLITIPDRDPGTWVARKWREDNKVKGADAEDGDDQPEGDGQKGDGFSVYEEYRGFRVNGKHVSPEPSIKNLFVRNDKVPPTVAACRSIERLTAQGGKKGLKIYEEILPEEWPITRIINPNRSKSAPRSSDEPQHGLLVQTNSAAGDDAVYSYADRIDRSVPRRPKNYNSVLVHPNDLNVMTVAHEITHTIGVNHHGDLDFEAKWIVREVRGPNGTTARRFFEQIHTADPATGILTPVGNAFPITVIEEGSSVQKLPDQSPDAPIPEPTSEYISRVGGQHSGDVTCYMRYDAATAYMPAGRLLIRVIPKSANDVPELARNSSLCRSCRGTGPNPRRNGHATYGNCLAQLCVRDSAPEKSPATGQCPTNSASPALMGPEPDPTFGVAGQPQFSPQALAQPQASEGVLVFNALSRGTPPEAVRGWPWHFVWHVLQPGTVEPTLTVSGPAGAILTLNALESGHWWISPEQTQSLPPGSVSVRVGSQVLSLRVVEPPVSPLDFEQDRARRLAFISFHLASGQPAVAQRAAEEWIAVSPTASAPRAFLGDALADQGLLAQAIAAYSQSFDRIRRLDRPPESVFQRYAKVQKAWFAQLPEAPIDFFDEPPEPLTLEDQDRVYGADTNGQWAATATASSEYRTSGDYSASRATGAPDVTRYGDSSRAWASRLADSGPEWLEVTFTNAVVAQAVRLRQVFNPGAINRIEVFDASGAASTVFSGVDTNQYPANQIAWFVAKFPPTAQPVKRVRISLDSARVKGWNEIDAVQLVAAPALPTPAPRLSYTYQAATGTLEIGAWPAGFVLQRATRLAPADWQNFATQAPVSVPITGSPAFFRLVQSP